VVSYLGPERYQQLEGRSEQLNRVLLPHYRLLLLTVIVKVARLILSARLYRLWVLISWLRPEHADHVWSYDFMIDHTADGRVSKILNIIDEFTRKNLSTKVNRRVRSQDVIDELFELFVLRGIPEHIRSDNGPEFTARAVRK
jgi:transposase InsO family protein